MRKSGKRSEIRLKLSESVSVRRIERSGSG
jgi:hypothetical protein